MFRCQARSLSSRGVHRKSSRFSTPTSPPAISPQNMNFARHLLRRTIVPLSRPIILPAPTPLRALTTPIPRIVLLPRLHQTRHESTTLSTPQEPKPSYDLTFTCRPCGHRSTHSVSKQGYHYGSILITCPGCHNRHVISDHLKVPLSILPLSVCSKLTTTGVWRDLSFV